MGQSNQESRRDELEQEMSEARSVRAMIESELFQKYFVSRADKRLTELKHAYSCSTLEELRAIGGERQGLLLITSVSDEVENKIRFTEESLKSL